MWWPFSDLTMSSSSPSSSLPYQVVALKDKVFVNPDLAVIHAPLAALPVAFPRERFLQVRGKALHWGGEGGGAIMAARTREATVEPSMSSSAPCPQAKHVVLSSSAPCPLPSGQGCDACVQPRD